MTRAKFAALLLSSLWALMRALVAQDWPDMPEWWRTTLATFVNSGARRLVARVGRRGGKSSWSCVFAVAFALVYATLGLVPPGDVGWCVFVSASKEEASARLRTIAKILDAFGSKYRTEGDTIVLDGTNIGFRVLACTVTAVSGWTSILVVLDEVAKWNDRDSGANPASEVIAAITPTMATQPLGLMLLLSSPLGTLDAHAKAFALGDTDHQRVVHAATWEANPSISREQTEADEADPKIHAREYAAIPQDAISPAFDGEAVVRAMRKRDRKGYTRGHRIGLVDLSSGKADATTWGAAGWNVVDMSGQFIKNFDGSVHIAPWGEPIPNPNWTKPEVEPFLEVDFVDGVEGGFWSKVSSDEIDDRIVAAVRGTGARVVHGDQRESFHFGSAMRSRGMGFIEHPWTATSKPKAVELVRRWLRDDVIALPDHPELRAQFLAFEEKITPSGSITFGARGRTHDDYVALVLSLAHAELVGGIPSSPHARKAPPRGVVATNPGFPF